MSVFEIIAGIVLLAACVVLTVAVLLQESNENGMNALTGASESYYAQNSKSRSKQEMFAKWTKIAGIVFGVVVIIMDVLAVIIK